MARHGGCCFSGKDPTKIDRSAAYMARYIAKNIVGVRLADRCEIQISYAIGVAAPVSIYAETFGTSKLSNEQITKLITQHFDMRPGRIIKHLKLRTPCYQKTAAYGHYKLREHYENITQALNNIREYEYEAKATQYREMLDDARTYDKSTKDYNLGSAHFITASGYKALLGAYKALNPDENTDKKLDHFMDGLDEIYKQSFSVHNLTNSNKLPPAEQLKKFLEETTDKIYDKLQKTGEAYLSYSNAPTNTGLHANVIKYSKENGKNYRIIYNAGAGVRADNSKLNQTPKDQLSKINETIEARSKAKFSSIKYELKNQTDKEVKDSILSINEIEAIKAHNNKINRFKSE